MRAEPKSSLEIKMCSHTASKYAVEKWHYSRCLPTPPIFKVGVWENNRFIGVVLFSRGANSNIGKPYKLEQNEICELTRVALDRHEAPATKIISKAIKLLKQNNPKLKLIVSYSDLNQGHLGKIYQAGNWIFVGETKSSYKYRDKYGRIWHNRQVNSSGLKVQYGETRKVRKRSECEAIKQKPKLKYLYPLTEEMKKAVLPLAKPYRKQ